MDDGIKQEDIDKLLDLEMKGMSVEDIELLFPGEKDIVRTVRNSLKYLQQRAEARLKKTELRHERTTLREESRLIFAQRVKNLVNTCENKDLGSLASNINAYEIEYEKTTGRLDAQEGRIDATDGVFSFAYKLSNEK